MIVKQQVRCNFCGYEWEARKAIPKACPDCKRRWPLGPTQAPPALSASQDGKQGDGAQA